MLKKKHLSKQELLQLMKDQAANKRLADKAPFTGIVTLLNYTLWKDKHWEGNKLVEFNERLTDYWKTPGIRKQLEARLKDDCKFDVEYIKHDPSEIKLSGNKLLDNIAIRNQAYDNQINELSTYLLICGFNVLLDMKIKPHKVVDFKENLVKVLDVLQNDDGTTIMNLHNELYEELGLYIEVLDESTRNLYLGDDDIEVSKHIT